MKYFLILLSVFHFFNYPSRCQPRAMKGRNEYYKTDTSYSLGYILVNGSNRDNAKYCQVRNGSRVVKYTPYEVTEFKFVNGRIYFSRDILIDDHYQRVFLERVLSGHTNLYYYRGDSASLFFIEKDSARLMEIRRGKQFPGGQDFNDYLADLTSECAAVKDAAKSAIYGKNSLMKFISMYNKCEWKPFPFFKYGFNTSLRISKAVNLPGGGDMLNRADFRASTNTSIGAFADIPIFASDFSLFTGISLHRSKYSSGYTWFQYDYEIKVSLTTIEIPALARYAFRAQKFRPYLNMGPVYSFNLINESRIYQFTFDLQSSRYILESLSDEHFISSHQLGFAYGAGFQFPINDYIFSGEVRLSRIHSIPSLNKLNVNLFEILAGISI